VEGGDDVEVLLARPVVEERLPGEGLLHRGEVDAPPPVLAGHRDGDGQLEHVEGGAGVAVRGAGEEGQGLVVHVRVETAQAALHVAEGLAHDREQLVAAERLQDHDRERERRAAFTSNDGFSVVAPTRTMSPDSTWARRRPAAPC